MTVGRGEDWNKKRQQQKARSYFLISKSNIKEKELIFEAYPFLIQQAPV
jgi:hypothetical protein